MNTKIFFIFVGVCLSANLGVVNLSHAQIGKGVAQLNTGQLQLNNASLLQGYQFSQAKAYVLKAPDSQAATDETDDGEPTGPSGEVPATLLADVFDAASPRHIREDFEDRIPFNQKLFRDHTSLNTYYFYPSGYLLKRDATDGFEINFLHRTRDDNSGDELITLTFTLVPRELYGGVTLVKKLAAFAIEPPANRKPLDFKRLPVSDVKISMEGLSGFIPEDNIRVLRRPQEVGDPITVQATMNQGQKENLVATIRDGGLSGYVTFETNDGSFQLEIPYILSFTEYSGGWFTDVEDISIEGKFKNISPYPLLFTGFVAYMQKGSQQIKRHEIPIKEAVLMEPGAVARSDKTFQELINPHGNLIAAWPNYERVTCDECLNAIEQKILVSPAQARKVDLPIEVIPMLFEQLGIYKVLVEIKSKLFSPNSKYQDSKVYTLREDQSQTTATLYINRDEDGDSGNFEYRVKPILSSGEASSFSDWKSDQGVMDITVTAADLRQASSAE